MMLDDPAWWHPLVVHVAVAVLPLAAVLRLASLRGRPSWTAPAALALLGMAAAGAIAAVWSGEEAAVRAGALPGTAVAFDGHRTWAHRTRALAVAAAAVEGAALVAWRRPAHGAAAGVAAALAVAAAGAVLATGARGGELVYGAAAGVGVRSGDPADVDRLLLAGLVTAADADARQGRGRRATVLLRLAARRFPTDADVQLRWAEALLVEARRPTAALAVLRRVDRASAEPRLRLRLGWLTADALAASGDPDAARAVLQALAAEFPDSATTRRRLHRLDDDADPIRSGAAGVSPDDTPPRS